MPITVTPASMQVFLELAEDAPNWSGTPPFWGTKETRGNLTQLKKAGLVQTNFSDGDTWVFFTRLGVQVAKDNGVNIDFVIEYGACAD